ncbi:uncharacterized protein LOC117341329 [Pecten maximus]|uniref:uncharacterized protein LOC117341329 n=1 Tax=Pecten maximus TaxID=6579 RepID=UPI001458ACAB|nr:uncharacterized protein LOC117341329 [Pecten maximus]
MASTDQLDLLKDFRGSEEEDTVKRVLKIITTETVSPTPAFVNLVIKNSNALDGTSFNDAYISLQPSYESMKAFESDCRRGYPKPGLVYIKDILNISILEEFLAYRVDTFGKCPQPDVCWQAFLTLFNFLHEKRHHEEAIKKLLTTATHSINSNKETQILAGLAHHLFSQLIPGKQYEVDRYADQLSKECDCGCKAKICEGDTSVGSWRTWHGRIDIMLNQAIAVSFPGKEQTDDSEDDNT